MEPQEKRFWVGITVFATFAGSGLFVVFEHAVWGWIFMVAGLGGLVLGVIERIGKIHIAAFWLWIGLLLTWGLLGYDMYDRHVSTRNVINAIEHPFVLGWGSANPTECSESIDGSQLMAWSKQFNVAVVCGYNDTHVDMNEDERITVTTSFTIQPTDMHMAANYSKLMLDAREKIIAEAKHTLPKGVSSIAFIWIKTILLPKGIDTLGIHKLSDVERLGGHEVTAKILAR